MSAMIWQIDLEGLYLMPSIAGVPGETHRKGKSLVPRSSNACDVDNGLRLASCEVRCKPR